ncbi:hypothetical protein CALVIDRAFT_562465 [Calocera viscosa TUFC12733]|uniref:J domain-containing protein n=1 Tax=Calocera viscosa (strain TUFC12733) TaxID=1330018 RepID=A0A167NU20_CALVF|nr:hypothetical protein CALVIDRAFT_562465 [Calocera viscosa TUFC12733]
MPEMPPRYTGSQPNGSSYAPGGATPSGSSRTANPNSRGSSTRPQVNAVPRDWYVELNTDELSKGEQGEVKEDLETIAGDYYSFLGLPKDFTEEQMKSSQRTMRRKHHPDKGGTAAAFRRVERAAKVLGNASTRRWYNTLLSRRSTTSH